MSGFNQEPSQVKLLEKLKDNKPVVIPYKSI